jgi:hypothetical protein
MNSSNLKYLLSFISLLFTFFAFSQKEIRIYDIKEKNVTEVRTDGKSLSIYKAAYFKGIVIDSTSYFPDESFLSMFGYSEESENSSYLHYEIHKIQSSKKSHQHYISSKVSDKPALSKNVKLKKIDFNQCQNIENSIIDEKEEKYLIYETQDFSCIYFYKKNINSYVIAIIQKGKCSGYSFLKVNKINKDIQLFKNYDDTVLLIKNDDLYYCIKFV